MAAIDLDRLLGILRRKISESDLMLSDYTNDELLEYIRDAVDKLSLRRITGMDQIVVVTDTNLSGYGITPTTITVEQGHMLACQAALDVLQETYRGKINRGELGVAWKSALEEESSISAEKAWDRAIATVAQELEHLIILHKSDSHATRPQ